MKRHWSSGPTGRGYKMRAAGAPVHWPISIRRLLALVVAIYSFTYYTRTVVLQHVINVATADADNDDEDARRCFARKRHAV